MYFLFLRTWWKYPIYLRSLNLLKGNCKSVECGKGEKGEVIASRSRNSWVNRTKVEDLHVKVGRVDTRVQ